MTPCFAITFLVNYSKQFSSKMIYVFQCEDNQLNRREKNVYAYIGVDLALIGFISEKSGERGGCFM